MNPIQISDKVEKIIFFLDGKLPGGYTPYVVLNVGKKNKKGRANKVRANKDRATNANEAGGNAV